MRYPHLNFFIHMRHPKTTARISVCFYFVARHRFVSKIVVIFAARHAFYIRFLFSHICVTRYGNTSRLIFKFCFTSQNIMLVLYVRRLIHSSLFSSHKSHFCFLLFQTRHFFIFNILLHVTFYVMCFCALPPTDIHFVLAS